MKFKATVDNVIIKVPKKTIVDPLAVNTGEEEPILIGQVEASGPNVIEAKLHKLDADHQVCAYKNRVALLPWGSETHSFYVVKEENIYAIVEP